MTHLHFTQSLEPLHGAGLGYAALGLHKGFLHSGLQSQLVATRSDGFKTEWAATQQFARQGAARAFYSTQLHREARVLVDQSDVVHGHGFYVYPNAVLGKEVRRQTKALVYHAHGFLDPWIRARGRWKKRVAHWLFENANFRHAKLWRALTRKEADQIRAAGISAPIIILPNGVDIPLVFSSGIVSAFSTGIRMKKTRRAIFLSRIHPKKGLDLLIAAWARLPPGMAKDWELLIFGPDEGGYAARVNQWIVENTLSDSVRLMGSVSGDDKSAAFNGADLFILPSYSEGFPMAVLEAAAHRLPVLQTSECNFPELTAAGGAWECLPNLESLSTQLKAALACDDAERIQRGLLGRALVEKSYSWNKLAVELDEACRSQFG